MESLITYLSTLVTTGLPEVARQAYGAALMDCIMWACIALVSLVASAAAFKRGYRLMFKVNTDERGHRRMFNSNTNDGVPWLICGIAGLSLSIVVLLAATCTAIKMYSFPDYYTTLETIKMVKGVFK